MNLIIIKHKIHKKNVLIAVARMSRFQVKSGRFRGASINSQSPQSAKHAGISERCVVFAIQKRSLQGF